MSPMHQQPTIVEPVDPAQCGELDGLEAPPRPAPVDDLGLVETVDRLGECVVVAVSDAADRRLDAGLGKALGVADADILGPAIRMMHEPAAMKGPPFVQGLFKSIEDEARMCRPAHPPADDAAGIGVDHEGDVDEARPGADIGEI